MSNKVQFKIGIIEFEAEGEQDFIEREREKFVSTLLPLAVDTLSRTRNVFPNSVMIPQGENIELQSVSNNVSSQNISLDNDFNKKNLAEYLKEKGSESHSDFILFSAYYKEKCNGENCFSKETISKYYEEARKKTTTNISQYLLTLAKEGLIIELPEKKEANTKVYKLSNSGIFYVENFQPIDEEKKKKTSKSQKPKTKIKTIFEGLNTDELNLKKYPALKNFKDFKDKMMLSLHIVTKEKKAEWFQTSDVVYLLTNIFGESATIDQVNGIFKREKLWFLTGNVEGNSKHKKRKLLTAGIDYAEELIKSSSKK